MSTVIVVTIGRNYGSRALPTDQGKEMAGWRWLEFKRAVLAAVSPLGVVIQAPKLDADAGQHGMWEGEVEDAACYVVLAEACPVEVTAQAQDKLRLLAARYQQDAIGFVVGDSELLS